MHEPQRFRPAAWEQLEGRVLPTQVGGVPLDATPVQRTDGYAIVKHAADLAAVQQGDAAVAFVGDSILAYWDDADHGLAVWNQKIAPLNAVDLGVAGDRTQNVLWRVENGELAGQPKVVVLLIGTNNLSDGDPAAAVAAGITADVNAIRAVSPSSQILLLGLLPRNTYAQDPMIPEVAEVNGLISGLAADPHVHYLNVDQALAGPDGAFDPSYSLMFGLHPTVAGYEAIVDPIVGEIGSLLQVAGATPTASGTGPGGTSPFSPDGTEPSAPPIFIAAPPPGSDASGGSDPGGPGLIGGHKSKS